MQVLHTEVSGGSVSVAWLDSDGAHHVAYPTDETDLAFYVGPVEAARIAAEVWA